MSAFVSCWHLIHQWVNILPLLLENHFNLPEAKPQLSKNKVEMLVNPFITLSLDYRNSPLEDLLSCAIYRMQLKSIMQPQSFLAFCHISIFRTINSVLVSVTHKINITLIVKSFCSHKWYHRDVVSFCLSHGFFFHQTLVTSKDLNLEVFDMVHELEMSIFKVMLASFSFYYIFKGKFFITSGKYLFFIDWKNINFLFCVFLCHNHNVQYYGENMGSDIFLYIYYKMFNKMKFISHMI